MGKIKGFLVILLMMLVFQPLAHAKLYKWIDSNGTVHFSQTPPPDQDKQTFETKNIRSPRQNADGECCMNLRNLASQMAQAMEQGATILDLHNIFHRQDTGMFTEIANFVSNKHRLGLDSFAVSKMAYDKCMNARFIACAYPQPGAQSAGSSGSGFIVSRQGHVLTNEHVVSECREIQVGAAGVKGVRIGEDSTADLALLKTSLRVDTVPRFRAGDVVELGEPVVAAGYPLSDILSSGLHVTTGSVSALGGLNDDSHHIQITAPVQPGNSGGPLMDAGGNIIGVVAARLNDVRTLMKSGSLPQNVNFAISLPVIKQFLERYKIDFESSGAARNTTVTNISRRAQQFTVSIHCLN